MANIKISALPTTGVSTNDSFLVINDAAQTTTSKIELKNVAGLTNDSGTNSMRSAPWLTATDARATGNESIAIGSGASGTTTNGIAIGKNAEATSPNSIAIGTGAFNINRDGGRDFYVAIGHEAQCVQNGVSIGKNASVMSDISVAIGQECETFDNGSVAIGFKAKSFAQGCVIIGRESQVSSQESISIGPYNTIPGGFLNSAAIGAVNTIAHSEAFVLGYVKTSVFASTTHMHNVFSYGQITEKIQNLGTGDTFSIDYNLGGHVELTITGNSTCSMTNVRPGSKYTIKVTTTGAFTLTPSASGFSFINQGGGFVLTPNGTDICLLDVWENGIITISHFADFS